MKLYLKKVIVFGLLVLAFACTEKSKLKRELIQFKSRSVSLPLDRMQCMMSGRDTLLPGFTDSELKLVVYSDSSHCSPCAIDKMFEWQRLIDLAAGYEGRLKFCFLFSPRPEEVETVYLNLRINPFDYPVFIDPEGVFAEENPHLPPSRVLHTFLLDKDNQVILAGSPLYQPKIGQMFYEMVKKQLAAEL